MKTKDWVLIIMVLLTSFSMASSAQNNQVARIRNAIILTAAAIVQTTNADCFDDWSRCTAWSSGLGGVLWQTCPQRCHCLGYESGYCVEVPNTCYWLPAGSTISRCNCYGTNYGSRASWCGF